MGELHFGKLGYKFVGRLELTDLFQPELNCMKNVHVLLDFSSGAQ